MESIMGSLGYVAGAFLGLVAIMIVLFIVNKILGGIKWLMIFAVILAVMAIYHKFIG